jgi:hypothetical protein
VSGKRILHREHASAVVGEDGRYRLIRLIGEDGLGQLWDGEDTPLQAPVTIRVVRESLTQDQARVDALHQQLNALYPRLAHANIASIYYYNNGQDGPVEFVVMEELGGQTLAHRLERGAELRSREGFAIGAEIAEGLQAAHDLGFAHAALTSHSVMLNDDRSVKILDFGLAALRLTAKERPGFEGPADDVLALGVLLREMSGSRSGGRLAGDPISGKTIGAELARLWRASLDPDPAARPTAETFAWALREGAEPRPVRDVRSVDGGDTALRLDEAERLDEEEEEEEDRQAEEIRQAEEVRQAEERRALLEAQATEARRAEEAQRKAEEQRALLEAQATEARDRAEIARREEKAASAEEAWKAQEVAVAEQAKLSQEAARAQELARQEEKVRTELVRRAENAARQAETARAAAAATRARTTKADEEARKKDEQAKEASGREEGVPGDDASSTPRRSLGDALRSVARSRARPGSDAPPSALPKRAERSRSAVGLLPRDRRWLWLAVPVMVTAFLVILFARPDTQRVGNQTPPTAPQNETDSAGIVVPDLRGLSYAEALSRLQEEGLLLARRVEAQGDPGIVVATDPSLGHLVSTGTRVTIFVGAAKTPSDEEAMASV